jgi:AGCS family alanine or glycine:cation symporter
MKADVFGYAPDINRYWGRNGGNSMFFVNFILKFTEWFYGIPILLFCGVGGIVLNCMTGFVQFRHLKYVNSQTFGKMFQTKQTGEGTVSAFAAACTALASTIGASNIVGVPVAIAMGGPGAVFWILIMALIG